MTQSTPPPPPSYGNPAGPAGYGYPANPQRANGAAIASLVLSILGCVPFITSLVAILLGIIGLRKTRDPAVGGKGLAIAGVILGILGVLGWTVFGGIAGAVYVASMPARASANQYFLDLSAGNLQAAATDSSGTSTTELQTASKEMQAWGTFYHANFSMANISSTNGQTTAHLAGVATFANAQKPCTVDLVKVGASYKVTGHSFQ